MNYNFLKDNLNLFLPDLSVDKAILNRFINERDKTFLLKHNIEGIEKILEFINNPKKNIFVLNGFMGSGKTQILNFISAFFNSNTLVFKNSYHEAINPDDILLSLFKDFSIYHNEKKINLPKTNTNNFSERINTYIKYCDVPMIFIFDSFEFNLRSKENQRDILNFINYLSNFEKVKIIISSKNFKAEELKNTLQIDHFTLTSIQKDDLYSYFKENDLSGSKYEMDELYSVTRGHFLLLELSVLIIKSNNLSLTTFTNDYKKSTKNFLSFLISKLFKLNSDKFIKTMLFLSTIRHSVSLDFLMFQDLTSIDDLENLINNQVVSVLFGKYYVKDYIKQEFLKSVKPETKLKAHAYLIDLYENELPLKPFERNMFLSRQTMRQEITFHSTKIQSIKDELEKIGRMKSSEPVDFNYFSYSKSSGYDKLNNSSELKSSKKRNHQKNDNITNKESLMLNISGKSDDISLKMKDISKIHSNEQANETVNKQNIKDEKAVTVPSNLDDYVNLAKNSETTFDYLNAILYYKKALTYTNDVNFNEKKLDIYQNLANCYRKIQDIEEAVKFYQKIYNLSLNNNIDKGINAILNIAQMYVDVYKFDKALQVYNSILNSEINISPKLQVKIYLGISDVEDNINNIQAALIAVNKALAFAEKSADVSLKAECYFKYALLLDDINQTEKAIMYYNRCIQISNNPKENKFLSSAYSNLAELSIEAKNIVAAKSYFEQAINYDKILKNNDGLYFAYNKLASLCNINEQQKKRNFLFNALEYAKNFDDIKYAISTYIDIANSFYISKEFTNALKYFNIAKDLLPESAINLTAKINAKIDSINEKIKLSEFNS